MCWQGKTHNAQMLGATESKQEFQREEAGDKPEQRIVSAENIGDKANSSLDRKPQRKPQQNMFTSIWRKTKVHSFWGATAFLYHAPKISSASKM